MLMLLVFFENQLFFLAVAHDTSMETLDSAEEVEEQEEDDVEDEIEEVWDMRNLRRSSKCGPSALECVKFLWNSLSLPVPITVAEAQQWIGDVIRPSAEYPQLATSVKTKDTDFAAAQKAQKHETAAYEKASAKLKHEVNDKCTDLPKI